ncbi:MAG: hypothetical protein AAF802_12080 [Planctomycetota bacterium]
MRAEQRKDAEFSVAETGEFRTSVKQSIKQKPRSEYVFDLENSVAWLDRSSGTSRIGLVSQALSWISVKPTGC